MYVFDTLFDFIYTHILVSFVILYILLCILENIVREGAHVYHHSGKGSTSQGRGVTTTLEFPLKGELTSGIYR